MDRVIEFLFSEPGMRLSAFFGILAILACWEALMPRRKLSARKPLRWASNLGLVVLNTVAVRLLVPLTAVAAAELAHEREWGLLNLVPWPAWLKIIVGVVFLDFAIYLQHVMFHAVPAFWRLHMVHHADLDIDVTTGVRFHTIEIILSMFIKIGGVFLLGPSALAVVIFEILLNATSMFNHANIALPAWADRILRLIVVTPDMHRVHHSIHKHETDSNFGFNLPWWDFLLGTYRAQPADGHQGMTIGLKQFRDEATADRLHWMLVLPFVSGTRAVSIQSSDNENTKRKSHDAQGE